MARHGILPGGLLGSWAGRDIALEGGPWWVSHRPSGWVVRIYPRVGVVTKGRVCVGVCGCERETVALDRAVDLAGGGVRAVGVSGKVG